MNFAIYKLAEGAIPSISLRVSKDNERYWLYYQSLRDDVGSKLPAGLYTADHKLQAQRFSHFSTCLIFYLFVWKDTGGDLWTLVHRASHFVMKAVMSVKHKLPLLKPCWLFLIIFLSIVCLEMASEICSIIFLGTKVRLTGLYFPTVPLFFLKMVWHLSFSSLQEFPLVIMTAQKW